MTLLPWVTLKVVILNCSTAHWPTCWRYTRTPDLHPYSRKIIHEQATKKAEADAFIASVSKAMKAAAKEARRVAKMHGTKVWVMKDGKIVGLDP